ncbi:MAG: class I SAM-dependent methyltransferase [Halobacteriota archaeon]
MEVPCVRVPRESGEETRRELADAGLVDHEHEIVVDGDWLFIPVTDASAVETGFSLVSREVPARATQQTPADLLGYEPGLERLGDIVILDEDDPGRAQEIADAVIASDLPVRVVVNRASKIQGELRVRQWDLLACDEAVRHPADTGPDSRPCTETVHREYGFEYLLDIAGVYFSPRLATERHRVTEQVAAGERVVDMFAGVGPFVVPMGARGAEVVGVDLNDVAVEYLRENARRNGVEDRVTAISGDVRDVAGDYPDWADRLVMNLPHSAGDFLDTAVELAGDDCVIHYYDIQHESNPFGPGTAAITEAAAPTYHVEVLEERVVRSYAPHELNVCLDVRLSR